MRPIDADVLVKELKALEEWETLFNTYGTAIREINDMPTLDVRPNIHAYWIIQDKPFSTYQCSNCKEFADEVYDFCPDCGAVMDGESV